MAATIDFAALSLQDALDLAMLVEEEAQERYLEFVDQMEQHHTKEAASFFAAMAKSEQKHGEELRDEEVLHQALVREAIRALPEGEDPDPGDYEDEPVAQ